MATKLSSGLQAVLDMIKGTADQIDELEAGMSDNPKEIISEGMEEVIADREEIRILLNGLSDGFGEKISSKKIPFRMLHAMRTKVDLLLSKTTKEIKEMRLDAVVEGVEGVLAGTKKAGRLRAIIHDVEADQIQTT